MTDPAGAPPPRGTTVVVGGGIAGLTAAATLAEDPAHDVLLLEASAEVGGKLRTAEVGGVTVDVGAEAMLARRPEGVALARETGLPVVHPTTATSRLWTRGALRPLPRSLLGVPADLDALAAAGILSEEGLARVRAEEELPPLTLPGDADPALGDVLAQRLGDELVDRLVEPLLGGVYAGHARSLSARSAVPQLASLLESGSLLAGARATPAPGAAPVFAGIPGGMARLATTLRDTGRFRVRTGVTVRALRPGVPGGPPEGGGADPADDHVGSGRFVLTTGPVPAAEEVTADRVVLAVPPAPAARLLDEVAPRAATGIGGIETASVAVVTLAYRARDVAGVPACDGSVSGFLVPPVEGRTIKAATFSFAKWAWVREAGRGAGEGAEDVVVLRASLGRHREERTLQRPDPELVAAVRTDLAAATGLTAAPLETHVQRWGGALPQYTPGHGDRVARVREAVAAVPGLAVCGAAYDGVGVPAVVGSARRAADEVLAAQ